MNLEAIPPISHERDGKFFNYRTCGIAIDNGRVLTVKASDYDFWLFPGGQVEYLESSTMALEREIKEELNVSCRVVRLLWLVEDFYIFESLKTHELASYYLIEFPENREIYEKSEEWVVDEPEKTYEKTKKLTFRWTPLTQLESVTLIPDYIKVKLYHSLPEEISLIILNHL